jgi:murein L,D-transpeptidase YafK
VAALLLATIMAQAWAQPAMMLADRILIEKSQRRLTLFHDGIAIRSYRVALGGQPVGAKQQQGDNRTPEGLYFIDGRNPGSSYHKALHISYPNAADRERAAGLGVSPGGDVMIHGLRNGLGWMGATQRFYDWTKGCVAVSDEEIDEIWQLVPDGVPVEIVP